MNTSKQLKKKEAKIHTSRMETYIEDMKEVTSIPKIDPISRKIAEMITKNELEILGIALTEPASKKDYYSVAIPSSPSKAKIKNQSTCITQDLTKQVTPRSDFKIIVNSPATAIPEVSHESKLEETKKQEMIHNLQHLEALKEELQRDYPELGLNNSCEGSSFHTNELHELEENIQNDEKADSRAVTEVKEERESDGKVNGTEQIACRVDCKAVEDNKEIEKQEIWSSKLDTKISHTKKTLSCGFISHSKNISLMSNGTKPEFYKSYMKASFLHSNQENISKVVPRCHVDIKSCVMTPIYYNVRVPKDSRVKNSNGVGPADSLRKLLLKSPEEESPEKSDFFSRSMKWLKSKEEKNNKLQQDKELENLKECTFDPYSHKKKLSASLSQKTVLHRTQLSVSSEKQFKEIKPKATMRYSGVTPAEQPVSYSEGIDREKFIEKAKPLIVYTQVNTLK